MHDGQTAPKYDVDQHLSPEVRVFLKGINTGGPGVETLPVKDARMVLVNAQAGIKVDLSCIEESEKTITADGHTIKLNIVRPAGLKDALPVFIFIHGGGWVLGDYATHKRFVRDLVVGSGMACIFVNYSSSPEAKYPQAINEIYSATKWVAEHGAEINGKKLAGIGGNMTAAVSLMAKERKNPEIKLAVMFWPIDDTNFDSESYKLFGQNRFLTTATMKWMFDTYTTDPKQRKEIYAAPLEASVEQLKGLPPMLIQVAENDLLRDGDEAYGRKLADAGVTTTTVRYNGVTLDWGMLNGLAHIAQTKDLIVQTSAELKKYLI